MSQRLARFKKADLSRAIKGVMDAGLKVARVEIELDGRIVVIASGTGKTYLLQNEWDIIV